MLWLFIKIQNDFYLQNIMKLINFKNIFSIYLSFLFITVMCCLCEMTLSHSDIQFIKSH